MRVKDLLTFNLFLINSDNWVMNRFILFTTIFVLSNFSASLADETTPAARKAMAAAKEQMTKYLTKLHSDLSTCSPDNRNTCSEKWVQRLKQIELIDTKKYADSPDAVAVLGVLNDMLFRFGQAFKRLGGSRGVPENMTIKKVFPADGSEIDPANWNEMLMWEYRAQASTIIWDSEDLTPEDFFLENGYGLFNNGCPELIELIEEQSEESAKSYKEKIKTLSNMPTEKRTYKVKTNQGMLVKVFEIPASELHGKSYPHGSYITELKYLFTQATPETIVRAKKKVSDASGAKDILTLIQRFSAAVGRMNTTNQRGFLRSDTQFELTELIGMLGKAINQ